MRVKALVKTYYDRRDRMPGDVYEMDDREDLQIRLLCSLGTIELVKKEAPKYETKVMEPEPEPAAAAEPEQASSEQAPMTSESNALTPLNNPSPRYRRRDMRARK